MITLVQPTLKHPKYKCSQPSRNVSPAVNSMGGFTLVEIMVVCTLFSLIVALMIPTFITFSKGMKALDNYSEMSMASRIALEHFSRDVRTAENILPGSDQYALKMRLPSFINDHEIFYRYDPENNQFTREEYNSDGILIKTNILFSNAEELKITYYNSFGTAIDPTIQLETSIIQLNVTLTKDLDRAKNLSNTDHIISARFLVRNISSRIG